MQSIKFMAAVASIIFIVVMALAIFTETTEQVLYKEKMETIMVEKGFSSLQEVEDQYPELAAIKTQILRLAHLNKYLNSLTAGPAPNVSEADGQEILQITDEIRQLRKSIKVALKQLQ